MDVFVVSLVLRNDAGHLLVVRKRGTSTFMQVGGKVEPGESLVAAAVREASEEVGLTLDPTSLRWLGRWSAPAANEPGWTVTSDVFEAPWSGEPRAASEIEELRWVPIHDGVAVTELPLAPLLTQQVIPHLGCRFD